MSHPSVFYKYSPASTAMMVLENSKLRWSSPLLFNDVAEFQRMPRFEPTVAQAHALLPAAIAAALVDGVPLDGARLGPLMKSMLGLLQEQVTKGMSRADLIAMLGAERADADDVIEAELRGLFDRFDLKKARVLCLTTESDNHVMWGTYADSHAGIVLGFRHVEELSTPLLAAKEVSYCDGRPVVGSGLDYLLYGDTQELREKTLQAICFTKGSVWSYEREWRTLTWRSNEDGKQWDLFTFHPDELESVTLGTRASPETEAKVRKLLVDKYPATSLYRMKAEHGELTREVLLA
jgi:hypothetical protein